MNKRFTIGSRYEIFITDYWVWPERNMRWNGGGYMFGARPYKEFAIGPFRFRYFFL